MHEDIAAGPKSTAACGESEGVVAVAAAKAARELANLWCDQLATHGGEDAAAVFDSLRVRGVQQAFALQVKQRLQADLLTPTPGQSQALRMLSRVAAGTPPVWTGVNDRRRGT